MVSFFKSKKQRFIAYSPIIRCLVNLHFMKVSTPDAAAWMLKFVFVYLVNTAVLCYSLTIICCCQVQHYIYWLISTENDHRHHHKFIKYEKTIEKRRQPRLEHAHCLETINNMSEEKVSTRGRKRTLTDSERKRNRSAVSSKWNKCCWSWKVLKHGN
jgi:hypothetical protein